MTMVEVLCSQRARDPILALLARSIWLICATFNIHITVVNIRGKGNTLADLLSRWRFTVEDYKDLIHILLVPSWISTHLDLTLFSYNIEILFCR